MTVMPNQTVLLDVVDEVATVTLNRPDSLNSMTNGLMDDLGIAVQQAESTARVVVITGNGRGFCSGADLSDVGEIAPDPTSGESSTGSASQAVAATDGMDDHFNPAMRIVKNCAVPTIARINGPAAGGGLGLALACDISIAVRSAFFIATFGPRLGIVPDLGSTWSLPGRVGRARAMGMAMLGDRITADQAEDWGLVYKTVDDDDLDIEVARATGILKHTSADAMRRIRDSIDSASVRSFNDQLEIERDHQAVLIPRNMAEGAAAFLEKRDPDFT